jgi:hypothetical protein
MGKAGGRLRKARKGQKDKGRDNTGQHGKREKDGEGEVVTPR